MPKPVLDQLNIVCGDVEASIAFYRRLGLDTPERMIWRTGSGAHHVSAGRWSETTAIALDLDSTAFAQKWNDAWARHADLKGRVVVGFRVASRDEVDALYRDMTEAGYRGLHAPQDMFWGARYAIIEDPDGTAVGVMSPAAPERRSPPPQV